MSVFDEILSELRSSDPHDARLAEKAAAELEALRAEKERADRLEAMIDRMSETIVELKAELFYYRKGGLTLHAPDGLTAAQKSEVEQIVRKLITGKA